MKIAILSSASAGGAGIAAYRIYQAFVANSDHEVDFFGPKPADPSPGAAGPALPSCRPLAGAPTEKGEKGANAPAFPASATSTARESAGLFPDGIILRLHQPCRWSASATGTNATADARTCSARLAHGAGLTRTRLLSRSYTSGIRAWRSTRSTEPAAAAHGASPSERPRRP